MKKELLMVTTAFFSPGPFHWRASIRPNLPVSASRETVSIIVLGQMGEKDSIRSGDTIDLNTLIYFFYI